MTRNIWDKYGQNHKLGVILFTVLILSLVTTTYAWDTAARYVHDYHTSWSADDGYHRGKAEWSGGDRRIRAGDDYVKWNTYSSGGSGHLAMVYHAFKPNTNDCGDIRVGNISWSWSNLPSVSYSTKGCGWGADNQWRANIYGTITTGTNYYFQHLFNDTQNGGNGEITVNTYWVNVFGGSGPYHGKFCINSSGVYAASPGC
jgi:hypothetical protein